MSWKGFVKSYFIFSRNDRIALFVFCTVILGLSVWPKVQPTPQGTPVTEDTALSRILDTAVQLASSKKAYTTEETPDALAYEVPKNPGTITGELFAFDPNTLPAAGWEKLGLPARTIKTILNYRSKGGHFYKPGDLKKIWGLPAGFYERVQDYITIADAKKEPTPGSNFFKTPYEHKERTITPVDVNTADTATLIALPGIGSKLAQRILAFRNKLGGFYSADQIGETYGLPDSTFQKLKPYLQVHGVFKKFNLNTASKDELKTHPYIKWNLANAIVEYRNQHGDFKKLDDLKNIMLIDEATYSKILPYLSL